MIALRIEEQKKFTSGLFIGELFDQFLLREADIVTFNRFTIDGRVRRGYYTGEEQGKIGEFSSWRTIKPVCFSLIRGKPHRPLPVGGGQEPVRTGPCSGDPAGAGRRPLYQHPV